MKTIFRYFLLISVLGLLLRCDKAEISSRNYPRLKTLPVSEITRGGALFNAEIIYRGDFEIINYGFVWSESEYPTIIDSERVEYSTDIQSTSFSKKIKTTLKENVSYFVRAFVETNDYLVYGANVSFISLGSKAPEILSFTPVSGTWGDTISIAGKNFSYVVENNKVELGDYEAQVIASTDSTLLILVPAQKNENKVKVKASIFGNYSIANEEFNYLMPSIDNVDPLHVTFGDTVTITGENFGTSIMGNTVLIQNVEAEILEVDKTKIEFVVPTELSSGSNMITLVSAGNPLAFSEALTLKLPEITSFSPLKVTKPKQAITISGNFFNPKKEYNSIRINGIDARIISAQQNTIEVELPPELIPVFEISVIDTVDIEITVAEQSSFSTNQLEIFWHSTWTKKKDFPGPARHNAVAFSIGDFGYFGTGATEMPGDGFGLLNDFWSYDPSTDHWVEIKDFPGNPRTRASSFAIDGLGFVGLGSEHFDKAYTGNEAQYYKDFYSYDPVLADWVRIADFTGAARHSAASFAINSKGYIATGSCGNVDPGLSQAGEDAWQYDPESGTWSEIEDFPVASISAVGFELNNKGYIYDYNALYEYRNNAWVKIPAPGLNAWDNIAFGMNGFAYFGLGVGTHLLYELDPASSKTATKTISLENRRSGASVFVMENRAYIIGGVTYNYFGKKVVLNDVWEFDPTKPEL